MSTYMTLAITARLDAETSALCCHLPIDEAQQRGPAAHLEATPVQCRLSGMKRQERHSARRHRESSSGIAVSHLRAYSICPQQHLRDDRRQRPLPLGRRLLVAARRVLHSAVRLQQRKSCCGRAALAGLF